MIVAFCIYMILGYWATGLTSHRNKIFIGMQPGELFLQRALFALILGWLLIPIAIIRAIFRI